MSAFAAMIDVLFLDQNIAVDALYRVGGVGAGSPVRVIRKGPDDIVSFGAGRLVTDTTILDLRISEVPGLALGDTLEIDGDLYEVRSEPMRDRERLVWSVDGRVS